MELIEKAKKILIENDAKAVLVSKEKEIISYKNGVIFLYEEVKNNKNYKDYVLADKLIGKAAAYLIVLLNIKVVFTFLISNSAKEIFDKYHIKYSFYKDTDKILNNSETDLCPMEKATNNDDSPILAYLHIETKLKELNLIN